MSFKSTHEIKVKLLEVDILLVKYFNFLVNAIKNLDKKLNLEDKVICIYSDSIMQILRGPNIVVKPMF